MRISRGCPTQDDYYNAVKVIGDHLNVRCLRESKEGKIGETKREINRSYKLPSDVDVPTLKSTLTAKGHLIITADKKK
ncbi:hypothetical protein X798_04632 [Onchocerca flexuosa]|uniref:SHSP domain-containing protein n=1 Tax=Onchocerca flexuosa TaxID=387005 RepID=A0A238BSG0_9BILA|nr:hypothetical protein X798_04632 [Onchocerca flexuosa]